MSYQNEEQEMEAEALAAIFDTNFVQLSASQWSVELFPETGDDVTNYVAVKLIVELPSDYPEESLPKISIELLKGLAEEHRDLLQSTAEATAEENMGLPMVFTICEVIREWLADNNVKGLDDVSAYATMMRKQQAQEKQKAQQQAFEAQTQQEQFTEGELEEMAVRKRREEGTPCNKENFEAWKVRFEAEMVELKKQQDADENTDGKKKGKTAVDKSGRLTGFQHFSDKSLADNLEALELAAENAERDEDEEEDEEDINEELFEDDVDLDDLDFDDEEDDDDEDDIDI